MDENTITYFGETDARNKRVKFGIKAKDRTRHVYVIGKTGMGKSTLLENMAVQDIQNGEGMCFIDPHGKTADLLMEYVPKERIRDVIYIAPFDTEFPISFNVLESIDPDKRHLVVSGLMSTFKKIWVDAWSARMEYILTNTLLALLEAPGSTLLGVNRMLSDKPYRLEIVSHIKDPSVKAFWTKEFANYTERQAAEAVPAIQNKVGQFTANPLIRNMIGQPTSSFDFRDAMDKRKIMIINLSKGKIGDENMKLLGGLLVTKIYLAAMSRADVPDRVMKMLPNFYLFVDEFQNFANASFADILSEARKYKLNLTIAHQYVEQMDEFVRPAVFGNVGTMIVFRIGANDAEMLENEFTPQFEIEDLVNLGQYQMYLKLMIDGLTSPPFSATNLPPFAHPDTSYMKEIIAASREQFSKPRAEVEEVIIKFHEPLGRPTGSPTPKAPPVSGAAATSTASAPKAPADLPKAPVSVIPPKTISANPDAAPAASKPPVPPKPATHKPFANLNEVLAAKPSQPAQQPVVLAAPKPPITKQAVATPAPVSLSTLTPKPAPAPRIDPKVPTPKNVSDLRSALAAALGTAPKVPAAAAPIAPSVSNAQPVPSVPPILSAASSPAHAPISAPTAATSVSHANPFPESMTMRSVPSSAPSSAPIPPSRSVPNQPLVSAAQPDKPQEVSEDVLKKVLKVD